MVDVGNAASRLAAVSTSIGRFLGLFFGSRQALFGAVLLALLIFCWLFCPLISPQNPYDLNQVTFFDAMLRPGERGEGGLLHLLGTDSQGRDILSAIFYGLRTSLLVATVGISVAFALGAAFGLIAGFFGGRIDAFLMRIVDMQMSIPPMLIALLLLAVLGPGIGKIIIAVIAVYWAYFARMTRGSALAERRKEYIEAAVCLALPRWRVIFNHLAGNCLPPAMILATVLIARAIQLEATLSFLGLGVSVTEPSLGLLIANGFEYLLSGKYWISLSPGVALLLLTFAINLVGDYLRDVFNPRLNA